MHEVTRPLYLHAGLTPYLLLDSPVLPDSWRFLTNGTPTDASDERIGDLRATSRTGEVLILDELYTLADGTLVRVGLSVYRVEDGLPYFFDGHNAYGYFDSDDKITVLGELV